MAAKMGTWLLLAAVLYVALWWWAQHAAYFPMKYPGGWWDQQAALGAEDVWLRSADGVTLHCWWLRAPDAARATLFLHGNAGNVTHRAAAMREIRGAGSNVLMLDYRGYGKSEGSPSEGGLYADADAAYQWLIDAGYPPRQIVIHGESLGTAVAVDLASRRECSGLVLEAPFSSGRAVAARVLPGLGPLVFRGFDSAAKIKRVHVPLLVIQGSHDEVIDIELGRALFATANAPKEFWELPNAGHNDLVEAGGQQYGKRLRAFYAKLI